MLQGTTLNTTITCWREPPCCWQAVTKEVATYEVDGKLKEKFTYAYDEQKKEIGVTVLNANGLLA